jgi:sulfatase maturation enzyme AslB (radical SAM superfamily)
VLGEHGVGIGVSLDGPREINDQQRVDHRDTCGGGYLPHRYSAARGFDNPSVWCADLLALFAHVRARMGVTTDETTARRTALR